MKHNMGGGVSAQKKGVGSKNSNRGEGVTQKTMLILLESTLSMTAKDTAKILGTNYNTYKEWKGDRRNMTGPTLMAIEMVYFLHSINQLDNFLLVSK